MERLLRYSAITLVVVMVGTLAFGLGLSRGAAPAAASGAASTTAARSQFAILDEAFDKLKNHYVDPNAVEYGPLRQGAITGMLEAVGDRELTYITPERYRLERNGFEGSFQGIGATVTLQNNRITIVAPIRDSPAERAGLRPGDQILAIDGENAEGMPLADAVAKIRGPKGTKVTLTIVRAGDTRPFTVEIIRDDIKTESVFVRQVPEQPGVAHILIAQFTDRTDDEIVEVLTRLQRDGTRGIILDVRNNPGGLLRETVSVTSQFLRDGIVLKEIGRGGNEKLWNVERGGLAPDIPLVLIVNKGSASGAEVLAGALQDYGRAVVVGTQTFGKGTVNQVHELSDQSALYIPIARWYTPKNRQIEGIGLKPDIEVELSDADIRAQQDRQFERALEVLKSRL